MKFEFDLFLLLPAEFVSLHKFLIVVSISSSHISGCASLTCFWVVIGSCLVSSFKFYTFLLPCSGIKALVVVRVCFLIKLLVINFCSLPLFRM